MNLIEIIITALKMFSLVGVAIVAFSYFFFKLKKHTKQTNIYQPILEPSTPQFVQAEMPPVEPEYYYEEPAQPVKRAMPGERFKVLNNHNFNSVSRNNFRAQAVPESRFTNRKIEEEANLNVYSYYSDNNITPMHKLKFSGMRNSDFR
ncbi:MAG: hypothetical protein K8H86_04690 [Ignavibacteriaceae bacterium]|nr:hypothetical protein [Ignavibacteriaceae bacterium]